MEAPLTDTAENWYYVAFTGSRHGMSEKQITQLKNGLVLIRELTNKRIAGMHGQCIGADDQFHAICMDMRFYTIAMPGYSAQQTETMEFRSTLIPNEARKPQTHFRRNRALVDSCDILIAAPFRNDNKGGTWYTINYAKSNNRPLIMLER